MRLVITTESLPGTQKVSECRIERFIAFFDRGDCAIDCRGVVLREIVPDEEKALNQALSAVLRRFLG